MNRVLATIIFLITALYLPFWLWALIGLFLAIYFNWYLEAPAVAVVLEATTTGDGSGPSIFPIAAGLLIAIGLIELARPRLAERRARITLR